MSNELKTMKKNIIYLLFLIIPVLILFYDTINYKILDWDDSIYLSNPDIKNLNIINIFSTVYFGNYHPVTTMTQAFLLKAGNGNSEVFHLFNLILHILNSILVFTLFKKFAFNNSFSYLIALIFAIHPMHLESVLWISAGKDLIFSFFYLLALIFYIKALMLSNIKYSKKLYLTKLIYVFIFFILSLLSKSMAITMPFILLLCDYYYGKKIDLSAIKEKIPFFILSFVFAVITIYSQRIATDTNLDMETYNIVERIIIISKAILLYIFKVFIPINLSAIHPYPNNLNFSDYFYPAFLLLLLLLILKIKQNKKDLIFGILFFIITISLVLQIIPFGNSFISERYTYIPYLGIFFLLAKYIAYYIKKHNIIKLFITLFGSLWIIFLFYKSYKHKENWKDDIKVFSRVLEVYPKSSLASYNRGNQYYKTKDYKKAISDYNKALEFKPEYFAAKFNRAATKMQIKDYSGAIKDYKQLSILNPNNNLIYFNLALCYFYINNKEEACKNWEKAANLNFSEAYKYILIHCK